MNPLGPSRFGASSRAKPSFIVFPLRVKWTVTVCLTERRHCRFGKDFVCKLTRAIQFHSCGIRRPLHRSSSLSVIRRFNLQFCFPCQESWISRSFLSRHVLCCVNSHFPFQSHQPLLKAVCSFNIFLTRVLPEHSYKENKRRHLSVTRSRPTRGNSATCVC